MATKDANPGRKERAAVNRARAVRLRVGGKTCPAIAEELGVSRVQAFRYVQTALSQLAALQERDAGELRTLQRTRLEGLLAAVWPAAEAGDVAAVLAAVRVLERLSKLLGLDAPQRHDVRVEAAEAVREGAKKYREMSYDDLLALCRQYWTGPSAEPGR